MSPNPVPRLCVAVNLLAVLLMPGSTASQDPFKVLDLIVVNPPEAARAFTVPTPGGQSLTLAQHRGKAVFLNFWATWCVPCREEMPAMERLYQRYREQGLVVLAISVDASGASVVTPFVAELKLTYPIGLDPKMALARQYGVRGLPASILIDRAGKLVARAMGPREWDSPAAHEAIESLLKR